MNPESLILEAIIEMLDEAGLLNEDFNDTSPRWLAVKWRAEERVKELIETHE